MSTTTTITKTSTTTLELRSATALMEKRMASITAFRKYSSKVQDASKGFTVGAASTYSRYFKVPCGIREAQKELSAGLSSKVRRVRKEFGVAPSSLVAAFVSLLPLWALLWAALFSLLNCVLSVLWSLLPTLAVVLTVGIASGCAYALANLFDGLYDKCAREASANSSSRRRRRHSPQRRSLRYCPSLPTVWENHELDHRSDILYIGRCPAAPSGFELPTTTTNHH